MSRHLDYRELEPIERRVALMRCAGASEAAIGRFLDVDYMTVSVILKRPRVARYLMALEATYANDIKDSVVNLNKTIEDTATRAFEIEKDVMERLYAKEDSIRAQLGAASTAQDILDRAGKRAPARSVQEVQHSVSSEALMHIGNVLREVRGEGGGGDAQAIDVTPEGSDA